MTDLSPYLQWLGVVFPFECMEMDFMKRAMLGLLLLAPMSAMMGVQVVNLRMAFFADAISHSTFSGIALGLLLSIHPQVSTPLLGVVIGFAIVAGQRKSLLSGDTVIGVVFSAVVAFGLAIVSREHHLARDINQLLYGDILTLEDSSLVAMALLSLPVMVFQVFAYNRLLHVSVHPVLAQTHRVPVAVLQYTQAGLLSLVVVFAVWIVGILLVTALLIIPAATARNLARSAGSMFWWALVCSVTSAIIGLLISAQPWAGTATGATVILVSFVLFLVSLLIPRARGR